MSRSHSQPELGIPCVVGTENPTQVIETGKEYTVDARSGVVYEGLVEELVHPPSTPTAEEVGLTPKTLTFAQSAPVTLVLMTSVKRFRRCLKLEEQNPCPTLRWLGL